MTNVLPFIDPYRERLAELRTWFFDQANDEEGHVAGLTIAVSGTGALNIRGCAIEPSHAEMMLGRLDAIRDRLERIAAKAGSSSEPFHGVQCQVIPLRRSA